MAYLMPPRFAFEPRAGLLEVPVDSEQPRVARIGLNSRFRHYVNPARTERRLSRLLADFKWDRVDRVFSKEFKAIARSNAGDFTDRMARTPP